MSDLTVREKFMKALIVVNKQGVMSRMNFSCCGSCASYELGVDLKARPTKIGGVHVNRQGWPKADESFDVCVGFQGANGNSDLDVGQRLFEACKSVGLNPDWDGTDGMCVCVGEEVEEKLEQEHWAARDVETEKKTKYRSSWYSMPSEEEVKERESAMAMGVVTHAVRSWDRSQALEQVLF